MQSQGVSPDRKQKRRQHLEQTEGGYRQTRAMTARTARAGTVDVGGGTAGDGDKDDGGAGGAGGGSRGGGVDDDSMSGDDGDNLGGAHGGGGSKGGSDVDGTNGREYAGLNQEGDANEGTSSRHAAIRVSTPPLEQREINGGGTTAEGPGKGKQKIPGGDNKQPQQTILNKKQKRGKYTTQGRKECSNKRTKEPAAKVGSLQSLEDPKRWRDGPHMTRYSSLGTV